MEWIKILAGVLGTSLGAAIAVAVAVHLAKEALAVAIAHRADLEIEKVRADLSRELETNRAALTREVEASRAELARGVEAYRAELTTAIEVRRRVAELRVLATTDLFRLGDTMVKSVREMAGRTTMDDRVGAYRLMQQYITQVESHALLFDHETETFFRTILGRVMKAEIRWAQGDSAVDDEILRAGQELKQKARALLMV